jgi:Carboxypeptidase regulatory-like domain
MKDSEKTAIARAELLQQLVALWPCRAEDKRVAAQTMISGQRIVARGKFLVICFVLLVCCGATTLRAQTETATVSGLITDSQGAIVPGAEVQLQNMAHGTSQTLTTNDAGIYVFAAVPPGSYQITVKKKGFKQVDLVGMIVNVQDHVEQNFKLQIGSVSESITVEGNRVNMNTTDGTVSTLVDQQFVANMPLNGRSFQDLILLTPGVVTRSSQSPGNTGSTGEFSVNGQRTESNYYSVDGVAANVGASPEAFGVGGSVASSTALGTTQSLVSVDALQEFRVQSSTYSAEYGRNPGAQISLVTRSGNNQWHGSAFDYLRNGVFDANDWFTDYYQTPSPAERQNDFGGTLGGPVEIPKLYNGKNKTFFFFSYEGLRLVQPQPGNVSYVPDSALRQAAPAVLQPVLNAFPIANGSDLGNGLAQYIGSWSNPSSLDAYSLRLDHAVSDKLKLFFRFSDSPSSIITRIGNNSASVVNPLVLTARTYTAGLTSLLSNRLSNDFRLNYTSNGGSFSYALDNFGGAQPVDLGQQMGIDEKLNPTYYAAFVIDFPGYNANVTQRILSNVGKQWNFVDSISLSIGHHQLKFGVDYRRLASTAIPSNPLVEFDYSSASQIQTNTGSAYSESAAGPLQPLYRNFSAFAQDEWHVTSRLSISMGLRWEVNPAPSVTSGLAPYTVLGSSLSTLTLAPQGTPLWQTTWFNFAPRLGAAYTLRTTPGWETVVRGGGGVFFDTGQQEGSQGFGGPPFYASEFYSTTQFPLTPAQLNVPIVNPPTPPFSTIYAFPQHLQLPYTLQWNGTVQQALGNSQALTVSYLGSHGSRLLQENEVRAGLFNPNFGTVVFYQNGLTSDYDALQVQFQRRLTRGLSALASYTWSHCLDYGSTNTTLAYIRGNCDFDVRHNFSSAISYDLPNTFENSLARAVFGHWGVDDRFTARTGFPVTLLGSAFFDPGTGQLMYSGLNLVPGEPVYLSGPQYPGGRSLNPAAFTKPPSSAQGDAPRNFARGFGAWQMDLAVRREFPLRENLKLQFRAEAFNIFNHPNFGTINGTYCSPGPGCTFGQATATLANSLGVLSPIYQQGAARSMQFALKLIF